MKKLAKLGLVLSLLATSILPIFSQNNVETASAAGYKANWGKREEICTDLSNDADNFYTGSYSYESMSLKAGGTSQSNAPDSALYKALQSMMKTEHKTITTYKGTRSLYQYTDCVSGNTAELSLFYLGHVVESEWDSGNTYNREHIWPNSKCIVSSTQRDDSADIMTLRATDPGENSRRGNDAYGESGGYYDPNKNGEEVRGDCARMLLYNYTRWGNTGKMWGSSGVIESKEILLKWMQEDPVDTWEMGRNDAVQSITGTRNVYVDYPEYAWLLFGEKIPTNMVTPSGIASNGTATPDIPVNPDPNPPVNPDPETPPQVGDPSCTHRYGEWVVLVPATEDAAGLQAHFCRYCGYEEQEDIPVLTSSEDIIDGKNDGLLINPLEGLTAGCEASIGASVVGMSLMTVGFVLLKGKKEDE